LDKNEKEKGMIIAEFFKLLGYETLCIDELKEETFPKLNNIQDVDVVAFSFSTQSLVLIEQKRKFEKKDYYKLKTLPFILKVFPSLGKEQQWFVSYLILGKCDDSIKKDFTIMEKDIKLIFWELEEFINKFRYFLNLESKDFISPQPNKRKIEDVIDKETGTERGITVELIDESYTSKCSFLDNELPHKHSTYVGKRIKRGLFRSHQGYLINADVNAAYNILLKSDPQVLPPRSVGGVGGYVMYPLRVSYQAMIL